MPIHKLHTKQLLPISIEKAWDFFSSPNNLATITPPDLHFKVMSTLNSKSIFAGMKIDYRVKPLFGIEVKWQTLISEVAEPYHFTDKQLKGPYKLWEHSHTFTTTPNGVMMCDDVTYQLPFGIIGELAHSLFVSKRIEEIFNFRFEVLEKIFDKEHDLVG